MAVMQVVARHWGLEVMNPWGGIGRKQEVRGFERGLRTTRGKVGVLSAGSGQQVAWLSSRAMMGNVSNRGEVGVLVERHQGWGSM